MVPGGEGDSEQFDRRIIWVVGAYLGEEHLLDIQMYIRGHFALFYEWGDNFVLHLEIIPRTSIWVKFHKNVTRYVLKIYFPILFQQKKNHQEVT